MLQRLFKLQEHNTTVGRELAAGLTTFTAMAYILAVNPAILSAAGMPKEALITVTALSAAAATLVMAFLANLPLALAPGMGINAFFAYTICLGAGVPWAQALGMVFVNGCMAESAAKRHVVSDVGVGRHAQGRSVLGFCAAISSQRFLCRLRL